MTINDGGKDNRAYKRLTPIDGCAASLSPGDSFTIKNISLFGTCILCLLPLHKDSIHEITFHSDIMGNMIIPGCVIWSYPLEPIGGTSYYETGFKFVNIDQNLKKVLGEFISALKK